MTKGTDVIASVLLRLADVQQRNERARSSHEKRRAACPHQQASLSNASL